MINHSCKHIKWNSIKMIIMNTKVCATGKNVIQKFSLYEVYKTHVWSFYYALSTVLCMSITPYSCLKASSWGCTQDVTIYQRALYRTEIHTLFSRRHVCNSCCQMRREPDNSMCAFYVCFMYLYYLKDVSSHMLVPY